MSFEPFQVAKPKAEPKAKAEAKPAPKPVQATPEIPPAAAAPVKKTRAKRTPRAAPEIDEHMLFMRLYNELGELSKGPRSRVLTALTKALA